MKKSNFDALIHRYVTGEVSDQERKKIEAWLRVMKADRNTELSLTEEDEERLYQRITSTLDSIDDVLALYPRKSAASRLFARTWVQVATAAVIMFALSFVIWTAIMPGWFDNMVSGTREKLILNDGTIVWLRTGSRFAYYEKEDARHGDLKGEALFEVAKIPNSAFIIRCGAITVKVLGTSFSLKAQGDSVEVKVLTGQVNLSSREDTTGINVDSNQRVLYTANGDAKRGLLKHEDVSEVVQDTEYDMRFADTRMDEVLARIERKFDVKVVVNNSNLNDCRVTVDMTDNSLDSSLVLITDLLDVSYKRIGNRIEFSGRGCR